MSDLSIFSYMSAIRLEPNDIVLFTSPTKLNNESRAHIVALLNEVFHDHESLILDGGNDLAVLRPESTLRKRPKRRSGGLSNG